MEETEKESVKSASEEISKEFKTLINAQDLDSLKQLQNLMTAMQFFLTSTNIQNIVLLRSRQISLEIHVS